MDSCGPLVVECGCLEVRSGRVDELGSDHPAPTSNGPDGFGSECTPDSYQERVTAALVHSHETDPPSQFPTADDPFGRLEKSSEQGSFLLTQHGFVGSESTHARSR